MALSVLERGAAGRDRVGGFVEARHAALILGIGGAVLLWNLWRHSGFYHDDAWITLRYAMNFVEQGDLSWNLGDRVEGYTEPLHLLLISLLIWLGAPEASAPQIVNAASAVGLIAAVAIGGRKWLGDPARSAPMAVALAGLTTAPALVVWMYGGLGALLVAAFLTWFVVLALPLATEALAPRAAARRALLAGGALALAYLSRPDAVIAGTALAGAIALLAPVGLTARLQRAALLIAPALAVIALHVLWREAYYGDVMPNTYYAKVGLDRAIRWSQTPGYLRESLATATAPIALALLAMGVMAAFGALSRNGDVDRVAAALTLCLLAHIGYVAWSGGDHMPKGRFLLPALGVGCLLLGHALTRLDAARRPIAALGLVAAMAASAAASKAEPEDVASEVGRLVGTHIDSAWPKDALIATNAAGALVYHARDRRFIDMLGLNDRTIGKRAEFEIRTRWQRIPGHNKGDGAYVLSRKPDFIIVGPSHGVDVLEAEDWFYSGYEMALSTEFHACYVKESVALPMPAIIETDRFTYYRRICA